MPGYYDGHNELGGFDYFEEGGSSDAGQDELGGALGFPDAEVHRVAGSTTDALHNDFEPEQPVAEQNTEQEAIVSATEFAAEETQEEEEGGVQLFSVVNPPVTVMVSALMDGRTQRVKLSPKAANQTESELADEIVALAELARQKGLAGQHTYLLENASQVEGLDALSDFGLDGSELLRTFMETGMQLPTPDQAAEAQAEVFATRYRYQED